MKKILLKLLMFLSPGLMLAQTSDDSVIFRINAIYIDEVIEDGDEGVGAMAEIAFIIEQTEDVYQTLGFESGYITSEAEELGIEVNTDLIPFFANYTIGGHLGDTGFIVEGGVGIGGVLVDIDVEGVSDDDVVFGGQFFGRLGYKLSDQARLSFGIRYMIADDPDFFGLEVTDTLNSLAFDAGLSFAF